MDGNRRALLNRQNVTVQREAKLEELHHLLIEQNEDEMGELLRFRNILPKRLLAEKVLKSIGEIKDDNIAEQLMKLAMRWYMES